MGRPLTGNALLGTLATADVSQRQAEGRYNYGDTRRLRALRAGDREGARTLRRLRRQVRQSAAGRHAPPPAAIASSRRCSPTTDSGWTAPRVFAGSSSPSSWRSSPVRPAGSDCGGRARPTPRRTSTGRSWRTASQTVSTRSRARRARTLLERHFRSWRRRTPGGLTDEQSCERHSCFWSLSVRARRRRARVLGTAERILAAPRAALSVTLAGRRRRRGSRRLFRRIESRASKRSARRAMRSRPARGSDSARRAGTYHGGSRNGQSRVQPPVGGTLQ